MHHGEKRQPPLTLDFPGGDAVDEGFLDNGDRHLTKIFCRRGSILGKELRKFGTGLGCGQPFDNRKAETFSVFF